MGFTSACRNRRSRRARPTGGRFEETKKTFPSPSPLRGGLGRGILLSCTATKNNATLPASFATTQPPLKNDCGISCAEKLGVKFRRQAAIGAYIVDFVCFPHNLIVELDGPQHIEDKGKERDAYRTAWRASRGFHVIRFRNHALDEDIGRVVEEIKRALKTCVEERPPPQPSPPRGGSQTGAKR